MFLVLFNLGGDQQGKPGEPGGVPAGPPVGPPAGTDNLNLPHYK